jgi:hypothetical protein
MRLTPSYIHPDRALTTLTTFVWPALLLRVAGEQEDWAICLHYRPRPHLHCKRRAGCLLFPGGQKEAENELFRTVFRIDIRHTIDGSIAADPASTGMRAAMSRPLQSKPTLLRHHNGMHFKPSGWEDTLPGLSRPGGAFRE